ncbi:hypothetical protein AB3X52_05210 [Nocardioides sp. DS6]|uniref:Nuclear transport factor 2 family protein n=1 Tax=Nocardioides eburneus TaxID=3231482 RepID=A0ABV3SVQ5_9ACTN
MRRRLAILGLTILMTLLPAGCGGRASPPTPAPAPLRAEVGAASVLRAWDARRSRAWASGSVADLRALYTPGSRTAEADVRMLAAWRARGLRVRGLATQLLSVEVLERTSRRLRLRVTDRVVAAEAVRASRPGVGEMLPRDQRSTYVVDLAWYDGDWLVQETTAA